MANVRHIPERSCVACGKKLAKRELIRVVRTPKGRVDVDLSGKAAGRGAYLCRSLACWQRGLEKGGLERGLKLTIPVQDRAELLTRYPETATARLS